MTLSVILTVLVVLIIVGVGLYFVNNRIPMDGTIKTIINVVAVIASILFVLQMFGVLHYIHL